MKWTWGDTISLNTERYTIRSLEPGLVPNEVEGWFADDDVMEYINLKKNSTVDEFKKYVSSFNNRDRWILGIWQIKDRKLIGFYRVYLNSKTKLATTSVMIGEAEHWGRGAVVETRARLLDFLFFHIKFHKVTAKVKARNFATIFNYKKLGFVKEGVRRQHVPDGKGGWLDVVAFGMLQEEWRDIRLHELNG